MDEYSVVLTGKASQVSTTFVSQSPPSTNNRTRFCQSDINTIRESAPRRKL